MFVNLMLNDYWSRKTPYLVTGGSGTFEGS